MAYSNWRGKIIYDGYGDHRGRTGQALFFYFPSNGSTYPDVFIINHSASQGESSLKTSAFLGLPFRMS